MQTQNNTIAAKHLIILGDQLQSEYIACKKAETYASQFSDGQLKAIAEQLAADHRMRFDRLFNYLASHA